jgi:hypothetical protein
MDDDKKGTDDNKSDEGNTGENFLGSWKSKEDAEEGLKNLQGKMSDQGNEAGQLRKQVEAGEIRLGEMQATIDAGEKASQQKASDLEAEGIQGEQAKISKEIENLDPVDEGYTKKLTALIGKSNAIAAKGQHQKTLSAATEAFRSELDERDVRSAHQSFDGANPDFRTPEMQQRIKEYIANDKTGMSDALVAFREIQRDDLASNNKELSEQNEELMNRLNLKKGTDETGTVILKSQGIQDPKPQTKTTGAARNAGMQAVLDKQRA